MTRQCCRPGCSAAASATLAYDYRQRTTWLDPLAAESHPMSYDLCDNHASAQTVPRGWRLEDRRGLTGTHRSAVSGSFDGALAV